ARDLVRRDGRGRERHGAESRRRNRAERGGEKPGFCRRHCADCSMASMTDSGAKRKVDELRQELRKHERLYYVENRPEITHAEFDRMMRELQELEAAHPELASADSPSRRIGGEPAEGFETVEHVRPMLSLENAYSWEEAEAWLARNVRILGGEPAGFVA